MTVSEAIDALCADLAARAADDRFTGSVAVTVADAEVFAQAYGHASRTWGAPATVDTRYDTASITKLFTAVAVLQQVAAGAFALDEPVTAYLGLTGTAISPQVTARHLLSHSSGIADDADEEAGEEWSDLFRDNPTYNFTELTDHLPHFVHKPAGFAPGTSVRYCNAAFLLLGMMVERATGLRYRDHVQQAVFAPAAMTGAGFFRMDDVVPQIAEAVEPLTDPDGAVVGWRRNIYAYPPVGDAAGGAYASVRDLLAFHRAARNGTLLSEVDSRAMFSPQATREVLDDGRTYHIGFGVELLTLPDGTVDVHWKEGVNVGTSCMLRHYPASGLSIAMLAVGQNTVWAPVKVFDRAVRE